MYWKGKLGTTVHTHKSQNRKAGELLALVGGSYVGHDTGTTKRERWGSQVSANRSRYEQGGRSASQRAKRGVWRKEKLSTIRSKGKRSAKGG